MSERCTVGAKDAAVSAVGHGRALKVRHLDLQTVTSLKACDDEIRAAAALGFNHLCVGSLFALAARPDSMLVADHKRTIAALSLEGTPRRIVAELRRSCDRHGLGLVVDIVLDRVALGGESARELSGVYEPQPGLNPLDPRVDRRDAASAALRRESGERAASWWTAQFSVLSKAGAAGFRLLGLSNLPAGVTDRIIGATRADSDCAFWAWTAGLPWSRHRELKDAGMSAVFASTAWWNGRANWYPQECEALRRVAPVVGIVHPPANDDSIREPLSARRLLRNLTLAAVTTQGLFVPAGLAVEGVTDVEMAEAIARANELADRLADKGLRGELRTLTVPDSEVCSMVRVDSDDARYARSAIAISVNGDPEGPHPLPVDHTVLPATAGIALASVSTPRAPGNSCSRPMLQPDEVMVVSLEPTAPVRTAAARGKSVVEAATSQSPIVIDEVKPTVDGGALPAKHIVGRALEIEADIFAEGHDILAAEIAWWAADEKRKMRVPLVPLGNDRWRASMTPARIGRHFFTVEAWRDEYATICHALEAKHRAGQDIDVEIAEARSYLVRLAADDELKALAGSVRTCNSADAVALLTSTAARARVAEASDRAFKASLGPFPMDVERPQAEFASWYELFPRSITDDAGRHGTFASVIDTLPRVRAMGFDVLYFPPVHPIGATNRKGRNNSLSASSSDPGSPYAIGSKEGGHDAIHPALGTLEDFRRLVIAARGEGLEIAFDFAIQCSLDHPWLREHADWFRHRPDGSIKYAENPPKKYEDIVNVDFYAKGAMPDLWLALRDVVLYWAEEGVRIFRVDNPHTKPLPFWQWMIADVRGKYPDVIFLSEAFTRPKMMYRLAKVGFSQSYTYFTWRNTKQEIVDYLRELTTAPVTDYFRPHFFVNTPDINPVFLQSSGRPGFLIRAALAATLSGLWGVYSGFELCEAAALPGREEYLDSEKYEIRPRDFAQQGNIVAEIAALNRLRKTYPALQTHRGVKFYEAVNGQILVYGKRAPGARDMILIAVSLDPHGPQQTDFELPLWEWQLPDDGALRVEDLMRGDSWVWRGKNQQLRLDPASLPFAIWRLSPVGEA